MLHHGSASSLHRGRFLQILLLMCLIGATACASPPASSPSAASSGAAGTAPTAARGPSKTLIWIDRAEPGGLVGTPFISIGVSSGSAIRPFNAALTLRNGENIPMPYLAEALP